MGSSTGFIGKETFYFFNAINDIWTKEQELLDIVWNIYTMEMYRTIGIVNTKMGVVKCQALLEEYC